MQTKHTSEQESPTEALVLLRSGTISFGAALARYNYDRVLPDVSPSMTAAANLTIWQYKQELDSLIFLRLRRIPSNPASFIALKQRLVDFAAPVFPSTDVVGELVILLDDAIAYLNAWREG